MKKLSISMVENHQKMSEFDMKMLKGGITKKQYCATLIANMDANYDDWNESTQEAARGAYYDHCK